jgi:hypothetical protein
VQQALRQQPAVADLPAPDVEIGDARRVSYHGTADLHATIILLPGAPGEDIHTVWSGDISR